MVWRPGERWTLEGAGAQGEPGCKRMRISSKSRRPAESGTPGGTSFPLLLFLHLSFPPFFLSSVLFIALFLCLLTNTISVSLPARFISTKPKQICHSYSGSVNTPGQRSLGLWFRRIQPATLKHCCLAAQRFS